MNNYQIRSTSNQIESRFSLEDSMNFLHSVFTELDDESKELLDRITSVLDLLPPREADFVDMYFMRQCRQVDIAHVFGVSQPNICYRLQRAIDRIKFLLSMPYFTDAELRLELTPVLQDEIDVTIVILMYKTSCQSAVAREINKTQGFVRHRFVRAIRRLSEAGDKYSKYVDTLNMIFRNLNILKEISSPNEPDFVYVVV